MDILLLLECDFSTLSKAVGCQLAILRLIDFFEAGGGGEGFQEATFDLEERRQRVHLSHAAASGVVSAFVTQFAFK